MNNTESIDVTDVATTVMKALSPLSLDERKRVLTSVASIFGISDFQPSGHGREHHGPGGGIYKPNGAEGGKKLSLVELIRQKSPATNPQRIAVFAHYLEVHEGKDRFSKTDILPLFATSKLPKPSNFDRDFAVAVREGWVHEDGDQSYLTSTGESAVTEGFAGKAKPRGRNVRGTSSKKPAAD